MNILLFTLEYPPFKGGIANYYGHIVDNCPPEDKIIVLDNNQQKLLSNWLWPKWLPAVWQLYKTIQREKIDHILVGQILPLGIAVWLINFIKKIDYTVFLHGLDLSLALRSGRKKYIANKILKSAAKIICSNSHTAKQLAYQQPDVAEEIFIVNPGCDLPLVLAPEKITTLKNKYNLTDKIILLSIGRLVQRKGFDKVLAALPTVTATAPEIVYVIAGTGPDETDLKNLAHDQKNVIFLGLISDEEKWLWLNASDIFIMPARDIDGDYEGFGIVYLEANLCGRPVIAGLGGGVGDAVANNVSGLIINPENTTEISAAIIKLSQDKNLRAQLGAQGQKRVMDNFQWPNQVQKIFRIIKNNL